MRVTIETVIDEATTEEFLALYRSAFDPLEDLAAARQSLTDEEFREEMAEESVLKFVGWNRKGKAVAMVVIATDLDVVPWISPAFWRKRYPEQADRNAIFYFGALLVSPDVRGGPWAHRLLSEAIKFTAANRAIAAFDCCRYNVEEVKLPRMIAELGETLCVFEPSEVDRQVYYAYVTEGLLDPSTEPLRVEIDIRTRDGDELMLSARSASDGSSVSETADG